MSTAITPSKGHRHPRSAAIPPPATQNPQNPHHLNSQAHTMNSQTNTNNSTLSTSPPRTPRKEIRPASEPKMSQGTGSKQKIRSKRPKNVMTSPSFGRDDRNTPSIAGAKSAGIPSMAKPIFTPSTAAYAGPTFHASPAPSTLPIPSFYSKSVPESPGVKILQSSEGVFISESPTPARSFVPDPREQREESPLDFFFKADREEKARARSASSTKTTFSTAGPFQPPAMSPIKNQTPPAPTAYNRNVNRSSPNVIFAMELDGESPAGTPYGPSFSTPYSERINAARSSGSRGAQSTNKSEALKAYLFSGPPKQPARAFPVSGAETPSSSIARGPVQSRSTPDGVLRSDAAPSRSRNNHPFNSEMSNHTPRMNGRSSGLRQEVGYSRTLSRSPDHGVNYQNSPSPSQIYENPNHTHNVSMSNMPESHTAPTTATSFSGVSVASKSTDIKGMEESLRKILKLV